LGSFLLCVRDAITPPGDASTIPPDSRYWDAYRGFRLLTLDETEVVNYDREQTALDPPRRLLLHRVELASGHYQLEWRFADNEPLRLPVTIVPGSTTQRYVLVKPSGTDNERHLPDLAQSAVTFNPHANDFDPDSVEARLGERLRYRLTRGSRLPSNPEFERRLRDEVDDPMVGLLAAHLYLDEQTPPGDLIGALIEKAAARLGADFPDVLALQVKLSATLGDDSSQLPAARASACFPPLLRRSWDYLLETATARPELIPSDSFAAQASRSFVNVGIWTAWRPFARATRSDTSDEPAFLEEPPATRRAWVRGFGNIPAGLSRVVDRVLIWRGGAAGPTPAGPDASAGDISGGAFGTDHIAGTGPSATPRIQARDLIRRLVQTPKWDEVTAALRRQDASVLGKSALPDFERQLLLNLQFVRQHLDDGITLDAAFVDKLARSMAVPADILVDGLATLAAELQRVQRPEDPLLQAPSHHSDIEPM
jgi:hypothetical protein